MASVMAVAAAIYQSSGVVFQTQLPVEISQHLFSGASELLAKKIKTIESFWLHVSILVLSWISRQASRRVLGLGEQVVSQAFSTSLAKDSSDEHDKSTEISVPFILSPGDDAVANASSILPYDAISSTYRACCEALEDLLHRNPDFGWASPGEIEVLGKKAEELYIVCLETVADLKPSCRIERRIVKALALATKGDHYKCILAAYFSLYESLMIRRANLTHGGALDVQIAEAQRGLISWSLRSKGRGFLDALNRDPNARKKLNSMVKSCGPASSDHTPIQPIDEANLEVLLDAMSEDVAIVDFINIERTNAPSCLVANIYKKNHPKITQKLGSDMRAISTWAAEHIEAKGCKKPLSNDQANSQLEGLRPLIEPFISDGPDACIKSDDTVVLVVTGSLSRIPLHAIPINGNKVWLDRNPIIYSQSLSMYRWLSFKAENPFDGARPLAKATLVSPMPRFWDAKKKFAVFSGARIVASAERLGAQLKYGYLLSKARVKEAIRGSTFLWWHGHIFWSSESAERTWLILNKIAQETCGKEVAPGAVFFSLPEAFEFRLADGSIVLLIGCASGGHSISHTNDVLGLPTAFFYAGASNVVSTMWDIEDEDGAIFAEEFLNAWQEQKQEIYAEQAGQAKTQRGSLADNAGEEKNTNTTHQSRGFVNIARAMQKAMIKLKETKTSNGKDRSPYNWASFRSSGYPFMNHTMIPDVKAASSI